MTRIEQEDWVRPGTCSWLLELCSSLAFTHRLKHQLHLVLWALWPDSGSLRLQTCQLQILGHLILPHYVGQDPESLSICISLCLSTHLYLSSSLFPWLIMFLWRTLTIIHLSFMRIHTKAWNKIASVWENQKWRMCACDIVGCFPCHRKMRIWGHLLIT